VETGQRYQQVWLCKEKLKYISCNIKPIDRNEQLISHQVYNKVNSSIRTEDQPHHQGKYKQATSVIMYGVSMTAAVRKTTETFQKHQKFEHSI